MDPKLRFRTRHTLLSLAAVVGTGFLLAQCFPVLADGDAGTDASLSDTSSSVDLRIPHIKLQNANLESAVNMLMSQTGIQVVMLNQDPAHPYGQVNLSLNHKTIKQALNAIATSANADMWQKDGVYYIGPIGSAPTPKVQKLLPVISSVPSAPEWHIAKIRVHNLNPSQLKMELVSLATGNPTEAQRAQRYALSIMEQSLNGGVQRDLTPQPVFLSPNGGAMSFAPAAPSSGYSRGASAPGSVSMSGSPPPSQSSAASEVINSGAIDDVAHRDSSIGNDSFGRGQGFGGGGFGGRGGGGFGGPGGGFGGQGGGAAGGAPGGAGANANARNNAQGLLPPGITPGDIYALDGDGSLIVRYDTPQDLQQFEDLVHILDIKPKQVRIVAQFVTVSSNDVNSFGLTWNLSKVNLVASAVAGFSATNTAQVQYAAGNVQTALSWILTTGSGKVVTSPEATTLNGSPAIFQNITYEPVIEQSPIIGINGNVVLQTSVVLFPVTTSLTVTPYIDGDGSLYLNGFISNSTIIGAVTNPSGGSIPIITEQFAEVNQIVGDGQTMVVNGLTQKSDTESQNKVPLLGDLPLIGTLFRSHNTTTNDSDLLVFITPHILVDHTATAVGATNNGEAAGAGGGSLLP